MVIFYRGERVERDRAALFVVAARPPDRRDVEDREPTRRQDGPESVSAA
jgi:hypothetical protein